MKRPLILALAVLVGAPLAAEDPQAPVTLRGRVIDAPLIKGTETTGLNVKPILPDKHYLEARVSSDRIVFRVEGSTIYFMDVVKHDDIGRYAGDRHGRAKFSALGTPTTSPALSATRPRPGRGPRRSGRCAASAGR